MKLAMRVKRDIKDYRLLDKSLMADLPEGFRKQYSGKLHITYTPSPEALGVDTAYMELQDRYGFELFPEGIVQPADQLIQIAEAYDRVTAPPELYNPFRYSMNEAITSLSNDIMDSLLDGALRANPPTKMDIAQAKIEYEQERNRRLKNTLSEVRQLNRFMSESAGLGAAESAKSSISAMDNMRSAC